MEEIEIRDALRRHVLSDEPPMGLSAGDLLLQGKRRQKWRMGVSLGSGGAATALLVVGTLTFAPLGGQPTLDDKACSLPLAAGWTPFPSTTPDQPIPSPGYPTSYPSASPGSPRPTISGGYDASPTPTPTGGGQATPTPTGGGQATPTPVNTASGVPPTVSASPGWPGDATPSPGWPSPGGASASPWPTPSPVSTAAMAEALRAHLAQCALAQHLKALLPHAKFASMSGNPPFAVYGAGEYYANGVIVDGKNSAMLTFWFTRRLDGETPALDRSLPRDDGLTIVVGTTAKTGFLVTMTGTMLSEQQLKDLIESPELDIFA